MEINIAGSLPGVAIGIFSSSTTLILLKQRALFLNPLPQFPEKMVLFGVIT